VHERKEDLVMYHVFVMDMSPQEMEEVLKHLVVHTKDKEDNGKLDHHHHGALDSTLASGAGHAEVAMCRKKANTISFASGKADLAIGHSKRASWQRLATIVCVGMVGLHMVLDRLA
jgi:hypothetical protein